MTNEGALFPTENPRVMQLFDGELKQNEGVADYVQQISGYLLQNEFNVYKVVGNAPDPDLATTIMGRTASIGVNGNRVGICLPISGRRAHELVRETQPDLIHVQAPNLPWGSGRILRKAGDRPTVASFHVSPGTGATEKGLKAWSIYNKNFQSLDKMISNSPTTRDLVHKLTGFDTEIIPCPIDLKTLQKGEKIPEYDDGLINVVFLGRLVERKGAQHLVEAFSHIPKQIQRKMRLLIAGTGELEDDIKKQIQDAGIENAEMLGFVSNEKKPDVFATGDIVVLPSTGGESFGIVVAEAMGASSGVVLGGNNSGYHYVLGGDQETLFDPHNHMDLTYRLMRLAQDDDARKEIRGSQQKLVQRYDIEAVGKRIAEIYRKLL